MNGRLLILAAVVLGGEWRELSMEAKKVWYDQAAFIKKKMLEEFPDYKYAPRRREQLKRRPGRKFAKKSVKKAANDEMDTASEILEAN